MLGDGRSPSLDTVEGAGFKPTEAKDPFWNETEFEPTEAGCPLCPVTELELPGADGPAWTEVFCHGGVFMREPNLVFCPGTEVDAETIEAIGIEAEIPVGEMLGVVL